jgi:2-dehydropantoate 2-reductase
MKAIRRICIVGAGAMGTIYASRFYDVDREWVSFLAGRDRYVRLRTQGIVVNERPYTIPLIRPEDPCPPADLVLVAVKHHQLSQAIQDMENVVGENTLFLSVMNGVESEERIGAAFGMEKVLYAVAVGIDAVKEGNRITCSTVGRLRFGEPKNTVITDRVKRVRGALDRAAIPHEVPEDMVRALWWKFMVNVGMNPISAVLRAPYGVFQSVPEAKQLMESAMKEVIRLAAASNVDVSEADIEDWYAVLARMSPRGKTSMLQDVEAKRKTEVEMFAGKVIELGQRWGIPTPVNEMIFHMVKVIERYPG